MSGTNIPIVGAAAPVAVSLGPAVSTLCEILLAADSSAEEKALDATDSAAEVASTGARVDVFPVGAAEASASERI
jgi:hypothetical protein